MIVLFKFRASALAYCLLFIGSFVNGLLYGQQQELQKLRFNQHLFPDEFKERKVKQIAQSSDGIIWIGTARGLFSFDGIHYKDFSQHTLLNQYYDINQLIIDKNDNVWIGTLKGGLMYYASKENELVRIPINLDENHNVWHYDVISICDNNDELYLGCELGFFKLDKKNKVLSKLPQIESAQHEKNTRIVSIQALNEEQLLLQDQNNLSYTFDTKSNKYNSFDLPTDNEKFKIKKLSSDSSMLFLSDGSALFFYDLITKELKEIPVKAYFNKKLSIDKLFCFYPNELYVCIQNQGLLMVKSQDSIEGVSSEPFIFKKINQQINGEGLPSNAIISVFKSMSGQLWVGSARKGLAVSTPSHFSTDGKQFKIVYSDGLSVPVLSIFKDNDVLWLGSNGKGLFKRIFKNNRYHYQQFLGDKFIQKIVKDSQNRLWVGTYLNGLYLLNNSGEVLKHWDNKGAKGYTLPHNDIRAIRFTETDKIYVSSWGGGFFEIDKYSAEVNNLFNASTPQNIIDLVSDDNSGYYAVTYGEGIHYFNPLEQSLTPVKALNTWLEKKQINDFYCGNFSKKGILWLGSNQGVIAYKPSQNTIKYYRIGSAIGSNQIMSIEIDTNHTIWLGTKKGLFYKKEKQKEFRMLVLNESNEVYQLNATAFDKQNNRLYAGNLMGYLSINTNVLVNENESKNKLVLSKVSLSNPLKEFLYFEDPLFIENNQNTLTFNFSFQKKKYGYPYLLNNNYYRFKGLDDNWKVVPSNFKVQLKNLKIGDYFLQVKTGNLIEDYLNFKIKGKSEWAVNIIFFVFSIVFIVLVLLTAFFSFQYNKTKKYWLKEWKEEYLFKTKSSTKYLLFYIKSLDFSSWLKYLFVPSIKSKILIIDREKHTAYFNAYSKFKAFDKKKKKFNDLSQIDLKLLCPHFIFFKTNGSIQDIKALNSLLEEIERLNDRLEIFVVVLLKNANKEQKMMCYKMKSVDLCLSISKMNLNTLYHFASVLTFSNNLFESIKNKKQEKKKYYQANQLMDPDVIFIDKLKKCIEKHISESDYDIKKLSLDMAMSHSSIYKRVKIVTGLTLVQYIRQFKLQKAAYLLQHYNYTVFDVSLMVGYTDRKYFSYEFKKIYGEPPAIYKKKYNTVTGYKIDKEN